MAEFMSLWPDGPRFAQAEHFRLGTDSVLLADFAAEKNASRGIDLGCASGILALLLLERHPHLHMTGLEIVPEAALLAQANFEANGMTERSRVITGDLRQYRELLPAGRFDLVISNPPYFPEGHGFRASGEAHASAREESSCTLEELCSCAQWLLQTGGSFFLVHRPNRLAELFACLSAHALEPKRLRPVCLNARSAPSLILLEARRGGKPGLTMERSLLLQEPDGSESEEYRRIYHR